MVDWSSDDPTVNFGGSYYSPPATSDEGIYLLEEPAPARAPNFQSPIEQYGPSGGVPVAAYAAERDARRPGAPQGTPSWSRGRTWGDAERLEDSRRVDYPEEPMSFNRGSGPGWARLIPGPRRGSPDYPRYSHSKAMDIVEGFAGGAGGAAAGGAAAACELPPLRYVAFFILVCVLVFLLVGAAQQLKHVRKLLKEVIALLRAAPGAAPAVAAA